MSERKWVNVECRALHGVAVLTIIPPELHGEEMSQAVSRELLQAAEEAGAGKAAVDLARVTYLSSMGIGALLNFRRLFLEKGGALVLCNACKAVADVLLTTRLLVDRQTPTAPFRLAQSVADAVALLNATTPDGAN